jgi:hypothetical protein
VALPVLPEHRDHIPRLIVKTLGVRDAGGAQGI